MQLPAAVAGSHMVDNSAINRAGAETVIQYSAQPVSAERRNAAAKRTSESEVVELQWSTAGDLCR